MRSPRCPPPSFLGQKDAQGSPSPAAALPKPPSPRSSLHPSLHPGCAALHWPGVTPPANSTIPAPHWGFLPDHPNGTALSPSQQQWPMICFTCIGAWGEGEEHHEQQDCPCSEHGGSGRALPCCSVALRELNSELRQGGAAIYLLHSSIISSQKCKPISRNSYCCMPMGISMSHGIVRITDRQYLERLNRLCQLLCSPT